MRLLVQTQRHIGCKREREGEFEGYVSREREREVRRNIWGEALR
jgi:hypothetical protein